MKKELLNIEYEKYNSIAELSSQDAALLKEAIAITSNAYAPYSHFKVGAAARLANGEIVTGTNQENASYPITICAERVLLSTASSLYPNIAVETIAISYKTPQEQSTHPISPCGMCRQALHEFELRVKKPMRIILAGAEGEVYILTGASTLLPLSFSATDLE